MSRTKKFKSNGVAWAAKARVNAGAHVHKGSKSQERRKAIENETIICSNCKLCDCLIGDICEACVSYM
jgi:hypothetical protein